MDPSNKRIRREHSNPASGIDSSLQNRSKNKNRISLSKNYKTEQKPDKISMKV